MTPYLTHWECSAARPLVLSQPSKIWAVCFAPASAYNDVLFLAKSLPAISYTACSISTIPPTPSSPPSLCFAFAPCSPPCPKHTTISSLGRNMSFFSLHATAVRGDLRARLKKEEHWSSESHHLPPRMHVGLFLWLADWLVTTQSGPSGLVQNLCEG